MAWLNYHHLYYFWLVVREGTIAGAAKVLRLSEPTVSAQIHELERSLDVKLFERDGRHLVVTAAGRLAYRYASEIFLLGREFQSAIGGSAVGKSPRLVVGVADQVPRLIVFRLLEPALQADVRFNVVCQTETPEQLLAKLVNHEIDVVISDAPLDGPGKVRTYSRLLGECGVSIFGTDELAAKPRLAKRTVGGLPLPVHSAERVAVLDERRPQPVPKAQPAPALESSVHRAVVAKDGGQLVPLAA